MKKLIFLFTLFLGGISYSQTITEITNILNTKPQTVTTADADATDEDLIAALDLTTAGYRAVSIQIKGTWTGTVTFQGSNDNFTTVDNVLAYSPTAGTWSTSTTSNGTFVIPTMYGKIRVRATTVSSGTISSVAYGFLNNVTFPMSSNAVSGTVTANQGGTWHIANITGTVSLPTGAATSANQTTEIGHLATVAGAVSGTEMQVDVITLPTLPTGDNNIGNVDIVTMPSVTIGTFPDNEPFNVAQINGVTPLMGAGNTGTGSLRVTIASDQAVLPFNQTQIGGNTISTGNGTVGTGVQRVAIASDNTAFSVNAASTQSGTWTVQPGNTANTTAWLVTPTPGTTGGWSVFNATSGDGSTALTNSAQSVKGSQGTLGGWYIYNPNSSAAYVIIYNVASGSVTVGTTTPAMVLTIPATSGANVELTNGIQFGTAISVAATSTAAGNGAPTTALEANFLYKQP